MRPNVVDGDNTFSHIARRNSPGGTLAAGRTPTFMFLNPPFKRSQARHCLAIPYTLSGPAYFMKLLSRSVQRFHPISAHESCSCFLGQHAFEIRDGIG